MATFTVTNLLDSGTGSLRQAIADANGAAGADTIDFQGGLTGTITLTTGQLEITDDVTITGPGAANLTVSGNKSSRVFYLYNKASLLDVSISGLTITQGNTSGNGGGIVNWDENLTLDNVEITDNSADKYGGGLFADGFNMTLTIRNSTISGNTAEYGGGIYVEDTGDTLLIENSTITGNTATVDGGGIYFYDPDDEVIIRNSTISGNSAGEDGGGIYLYDTDGGPFIIENSTISGNIADDDGGGIYFYQPDDEIIIRNSTISGNTANDEGGGIFLYNPGAPVTIENSTISGNSAVGGDGGGIHLYDIEEPVIIRNSTITANTANEEGGGIYIDDGPEYVTIESTIVSGNTANIGADIYNDVSSKAVTIIKSLLGTAVAGGPSTETNVITGQDPLLGPLQNNGGSTQTHALLAGSPAIDAGSNPGFTLIDQRGLPYFRIYGPAADIGAYEVQPPFVPSTPTQGPDNLAGSAIGETISGLNGSDIILGGAGDDRINGDSPTVLPAGWGNGNDLLFGEDGYDDLFGGDGNDSLDGGAQDDYLDGGNGNDLLIGSAGYDDLIGGFGNDTLLGGTDNDYLNGGWGNDSLDGGTGSDWLVGGMGSDTLYGGLDDDYFVVQANTGRDFILDYNSGEGDTIELGSGLYAFGPNRNVTLVDTGSNVNIVYRGSTVMATVLDVEPGDIDFNGVVFR